MQTYPGCRSQVVKGLTGDAASNPSSEEKPRESKSGKGSHELKREKKGKDNKRGRKHKKRSRK